MSFSWNWLSYQEMGLLQGDSTPAVLPLCSCPLLLLAFYHELKQQEALARS
jgi:hypothetical protein